MTITYLLEQRDFYEALLAHRNRFALTKWFFRFMLFVWLACVVITVLGTALGWGHEVQKNFLPLVLLGAFWLFMFWGAPWLAARNQYWKQPSAQGAKTLLVDKAGVHWHWNGGSADIEWQNFIRFKETKNQFLLYSSPVCFNIVPKRTLTLDQVSAFRQLVAENLPLGAASAAHKGKKSVRNPVLWVVVIVAFEVFLATESSTIPLSRKASHQICQSNGTAEPLVLHQET